MWAGQQPPHCEPKLTSHVDTNDHKCDGTCDRVRGFHHVPGRFTVTTAILILVILLVLSDISASGIRRDMQARIEALRTELAALRHQLDRRFF